MVADSVTPKFMRDNWLKPSTSPAAPTPPTNLEVCPHTGRFYFIGRFAP